MFKRYKVQNNEYCLCGSGKRYNDCCKDRQDKKMHPKRIENLPSEYFRSSIVRKCLYPGCQARSKKVIGAHALQNNRILSKLEINRHVIIKNINAKPSYVEMDNGEQLTIYNFNDVGVNKATKYPCFCKEHDDGVFSEIEKNGCNFELGNEKQEFLYSYKAVSFEYYLQEVNNSQHTKIIKDLPSKLKDYKFVYKMRLLEQKKKDMEYYKNVFDGILVSEDYSKLKSFSFEVEEELDFANFACISPAYDLYGKSIRSYRKDKGINSNIFITIFPDQGKSFIVISYLKEDYKNLKRLFKQFEAVDMNLLKFYLNVIIPVYSDNIVLSPRLWNKWSEEIQVAFTYFNNLNGHQDIMLKAISFGLKNNRRHKNKSVDYASSKINMFG